MRFNKTGKIFINKNIKWEYRKKFNTFQFPENLDKEIEKRRENHNVQLRKFFPNSYLIWHWLYPAPNGTVITNLFVNRRIITSYEPFIDSKMFRLAISIPEKWKLNHKYFNKAMKNIFRETRSIFHTSGTLPYYSYKPINLFLNILTRSIWKIEDLLRNLIGLSKKNRFSWPQWNEVVKTQSYNYKASELLDNYSDSEISEKLSLKLRIKNGLPKEKLNTLQIFYWLNWMDKVKLQLNDQNPQD
jgi:hypothetical protein